jgi:hypothetical protein
MVLERGCRQVRFPRKPFAEVVPVPGKVLPRSSDHLGWGRFGTHLGTRSWQTHPLGLSCFRDYDGHVRSASPLTLLLITGVLAGCGEGSSETDDAAANDAILSQLPTYPHAEIYDKSVNAYESEYVGGAEPLGHTTNVNYQVPEGTDPFALVRFYSSRLKPEWRCRRAQGEPLLHCRRGTAILGVNPDNLGATPPRYELVVDHNDRTP